MNRNNFYPGVYLFWSVALLALPIWWVSYPETTVKHSFQPVLVYASQIASLLGFSFFALSFVLSTRWKVLENLFGGLDKAYHTHHSLAKMALFCMLAHPMLLASRWIPKNISKTLWFLFPVHRRMEINIGSWALWGVVLLLFFTLVLKLRYHLWKYSHKFLGVFFLFAVVHIVWTDPTMLGNPWLKIYIWSLSLLAASAWMYKTLLYSFLKKHFHYRVSRIHRFNEEVMEIGLQPLAEQIRFAPGQFSFFSIRSPGISPESHPYTILQVQENGEISVLVKSLGDYTSILHKSLKEGATAVIDGPYGRFDYRKRSQSQVWIGGGVGIAPFISWANDLLQNPPRNQEIDIYYCVNHSSEATHLSVFEKLQKAMPSTRLHLISRDKEGFLHLRMIDEILRKELFICGPKEMREALLSESKRLGIQKGNIYYEDFDFV